MKEHVNQAPVIEQRQAVGRIFVRVELECLGQRRDIAFRVLLTELAEITPGAPAEVVARVDGKEAQTLQSGSEPGGESIEGTATGG